MILKDIQNRPQNYLDGAAPKSDVIKEEEFEESIQELTQSQQPSKVYNHKPSKKNMHEFMKNVLH